MLCELPYMFFPWHNPRCHHSVFKHPYAKFYFKKFVTFVEWMFKSLIETLRSVLMMKEWASSRVKCLTGFFTSLRCFYIFRIVIQNDRQKLKSKLKIAWFTKGNFGWPFFKPEPSANTLISLNEKWSRLIISVSRWVLFLRARPFCW